jgi:hypothetical protein
MMASISFMFQRTRVAGTRPGLHPSMGSEQPAHPWAGLLLDGTRPPAWQRFHHEGNAEA